MLRRWLTEFQVWLQARELRAELVADGARRLVEILDGRKRGLMPYHIDRGFLEWLENVERDLQHPNVDVLHDSWVRFG